MSIPVFNGSNFENVEDSIDIGREIKRYLRYWPWIVLTVFIALTVAFVYLRYTPRIYNTTSKIKILDESEGLELPTSAFIFKRSNINLQNEIEILASYRILEQVAYKLKLNTVFFEEGQIQTSHLADLPFSYEQLVKPDSVLTNSKYAITVNKNNFEVENLSSETVVTIENHNSYNQEHQLPFEIILDNEKQNLIDKKFIVQLIPLKSAVRRLKSKLSVEPIGDLSHILTLSIKGESTTWNERVLNTLVETFNRDGIKDRQLISKRTLDFIDERFIYLASELDSIEINKKEFKQENDLIYMETDAAMGLQNRSQAELEVFKIENQIALSEFIKDAVANNQEGLLPANVGIESGGINQLITQYNETVLERDNLVVSGGLNNPFVKQLNITLSDLKSNINKSIQTYSNQLNVSLRQLESRNIRFSGEVSRLPEKEKLLRDIERQQKIKESLYLLLLQKREEAAINLAITEPSLKIVEYALSSGPVSPKENIVYTGGILAGLLIPIGILYLIFMLDTKVHTKEDVKSLDTQLAVIAEIPNIRSKEEQIFENPNDRSVLAESFRILSSNVDYLLPQANDGLGQVIYCTSTIKGEGKTYISVNLSLALSSLNKKVLLIGADLRNPKIHKHIKHDKNQNGLSNFMHDSSIEWRDLIISAFKKHGKHHTIISGSIPPNPAHLLTNGRLEQLIKEAKLEYDYIIVDTAPTILVTDTMLISKLADATLFIVRANFTEKNVLEFSKDLAQNNRLQNMAYVINGVGASKSYGYKYNYGYGYGYGRKS